MIDSSDCRVFVVSGPSGVGKTTIIHRILANNPDMELSVSSTTRPPRAGEVHGKDYFFIERELFEEIVKGEEFMEWATVYDNYYGTSYHHVLSILHSGHHALLDLDTQGAMRIKKLTHGAVFLLIAPPSLKVLGERLRSRGSESDESLARRMGHAEHELSFHDEYDHVVINDDIETAVSDVQGIIDAERSRYVKFVYHAE